MKIRMRNGGLVSQRALKCFVCWNLILLVYEVCAEPIVFKRGHVIKNVPWSFEIKELEVLWNHTVTFRTQNLLTSKKKKKHLLKPSCKNNLFCTSATWREFTRHWRLWLHVDETYTGWLYWVNADIMQIDS